MKFISLVKRVAPFFLTFAVGLFIASFFVTVAAPNFQFRRGFNRHQQYHRRIESENQQLREENNRLKNRLAEAEKRDWVLESDLDVPPPAPPVPPTMPMKTVPYKAR
jgi:cell shape-determining protein MreC